MASGSYTQSVRQSLRNKGVQDSDIGYDPNTGYVQVKGQNFLKPSKNISGTTFDTADNFNNAWSQYSKPQNNQPTGSPYNRMGGAQNDVANPTNGGFTGQGFQQGIKTPQTFNTQNPYDQQYNDQLKALMQISQNPTQVDTNQIFASPQYQAIKAQQDVLANQQYKQDRSGLLSRGFGDSTYLTDRNARINADENAKLMGTVLPQLVAQQQAEKQQQYQNQIGMLNQLSGQQTLYDKRYNDVQDLALRKGEAFGTYEDPNAAAIKELIALNSSKYATATPDEQQRLHNENLGLAAQIGGRDTTGQGDYEYSSMRTLRGQEADLNRTQTMAKLTGYLPDGTPTTDTQQQHLNDLWNAAEQTGYVPNEIADLYGIPRGTQTQAAIKQAASIADQIQRNEISASRESRIASTPKGSSSKSSAKSEAEAETGGAKVSSAQFNDAFQTLQKKYGVARYKETKDAKGNKVFDESAPVMYGNTTNPDQQAKLVVDVLNLGLNDDQTLQMWNKLGVTEDLARELLGG